MASTDENRRKSRDPPTENINPDIARERQNAKFDPVEITHVLDGGREVTERRRLLESEAFDDPVFDNPTNMHFMTDEERHTNGVRKAIHATRRLKQIRPRNDDEEYAFKKAVHREERFNFSLHDGMFTHVIASQMTPEQQAKWLTAAKTYTLIGTYAQTELGHGTFVRGLQTTATYVPETQEFEIHTPILSAMKWWPGELGKTSTHAIVVAQLITGGSRKGIHMFMVPLRSLKDHRPFPGIEIGTIGPTLGYHNIDNGFLRFTRYRIPRENMCMKLSQVLPDGTYVPPANTKIAYGTMVNVRASIVANAGSLLARGVVIATRYSVIRRQSEIVPGDGEAKILDYQSQQLKILPNMATAYALCFTGHQMKRSYATSVSEMDRGNFTSLPELHATSAGLKAFTTSCMASGLEELRMSCGGHGYSMSSGYPELYSLSVALCTLEGETTVMLLQTARYLMKMAKQLGSSNKLVGCAAYLQANTPARCPAAGPGDFHKQEVLVDAFRHRAKRVVMLAAQRMAEDIKRGQTQPIAWNNSHLYLIQAAKVHCHLYCVESFFNGINAAQVSKPARDALTALCHLYALYGISENRGDFLQDGYMSRDQLGLVEQEIIALLAYLRPIAVALVDAFDFPDQTLASVLGRYDGNVYENLYKWAKSAPMNRREVPEAYTYLGPFLKENIANAKL